MRFLDKKSLNYRFLYCWSRFCPYQRVISLPYQRYWKRPLRYSGLLRNKRPTILWKIPIIFETFTMETTGRVYTDLLASSIFSAAFIKIRTFKIFTLTAWALLAFWETLRTFTRIITNFVYTTRIWRTGALKITFININTKFSFIRS